MYSISQSSPDRLTGQIQSYPLSCETQIFEAAHSLSTQKSTGKGSVGLKEGKEELVGLSVGEGVSGEY